MRQNCRPVGARRTGENTLSRRASPRLLRYLPGFVEPPGQPWLGPDILDYLRDLAATAARDVVVAPIGFISDHMEVVYDLDIEARRLCGQLGLNMVRAETVGADKRFVAMIRELVLERIHPGSTHRALGAHGPAHDVCPADCCPGPTPIRRA